MASQVPPEVFELIAAAARDAGVEVYHAEISGRELRIQVESPSGASVRACSEFSRALTTRLDAADFLRRQYTLEVSTPGIERRLYRPQDYAKALNQHVRVLVRDGWAEGLLEAAGPTGITIRNESGPVPTREFAYADIREAHIRVSDSELFARSPAETKNPVFNHQGTKVTKQTRPFSFGPVFVSLCLCGELLLRFFGERIT
jgi:ribosome maturation factor RimP